MDNNKDPNSLGPIEYQREVVESTNDPQYNKSVAAVGEQSVTKEQVIFAAVGIILALPFPILIIILWISLNGLKGQPQTLGDGTMNLIWLYLFQFFIVPVLTVCSAIIAFLVTTKSKQLAKKLGYISLGVTGLGFVLLGLFLNNT